MPEEKKEIKRIPARYIGSTFCLLGPGQGTGFNIDGSRRETKAVSQGDMLLMPEREILGHTQLTQGDQVFDLGTGKRVKPEHQGLDERDLSLIGYDFHQGRRDFEALSDEEREQEMKRLAPPSSPETTEQSGKPAKISKEAK